MVVSGQGESREEGRERTEENSSGGLLSGWERDLISAEGGEDRTAEESDVSESSEVVSYCF